MLKAIQKLVEATQEMIMQMVHLFTQDLLQLGLWLKELIVLMIGLYLIEKEIHEKEKKEREREKSKYYHRRQKVW